jgi:hypothetical protein
MYVSFRYPMYGHMGALYTMAGARPFPGCQKRQNIARTDLVVRAVRYHIMYFNFRYPMYSHMGASYTMASTISFPYIVVSLLALFIIYCLIATVFHVMLLYIYRCMGSL